LGDEDGYEGSRQRSRAPSVRHVLIWLTNHSRTH
jgi:hypothetical protein